MAAPALCRAFSQNAWRRDLCSNCFRSKEEHKAAAAARQKSPTAAARLASTSIVKSILKGSSRSTNGVGKKGRCGVSFHKEESQVIGYGGDDEIHSADEEEMVEVETQNEEEMEREKAEQQVLERLTKANTDFNSVIANLQIEAISQEKQSTGKGSASGIPVPGGRSSYTGPLRLGLGSKDNDGNKKTLLVSVRPFGSSGEESSKTPPAKTKITVTNGYGSATNQNGSSKESKDCSKATVNGSMTNGFGYSSISTSKEISVKVSVSSNGVESKSTVINNGSSWKGSAVNGSNVPNVNGSSDIPQVKSKMLNGHSKQMDVKAKDASINSSSGSEINGELSEIIPIPNEKVNGAAVMSKIAIPVPASRSFTPKEDVSQEVVSKEEVLDSSGIVPSSSDSGNSIELIAPLKNGIDTETLSKTMGKEDIKDSEGQVTTSDQQLIIPSSANHNCNANNSPELVVAQKEQAPVPAERNILPDKAESSTVEKDLSKIQSVSSEIVMTEIQEKVEVSFEKVVKTEVLTENTLKESKTSFSAEVITTETKEIISNSVSEVKSSINETKSIKSEAQISQVAPTQSINKNIKSKNIFSKQETIHAKNSEDPLVAGKKVSPTKSSSNSGATGAPKIPAVSKRPAPSILKMGVPTGWSSKSGSQKLHTPSLTNAGGKDSSEEKVSNERANIVNGILKTQPTNAATAGQEKALKPVNTIAKLRANFVNNNLKIIAESAAKIVNGTRYGGKNSLADEIPISKSSVMNLSMRPISTNNVSNKTFPNEDNDLKGSVIKGLYNSEKVPNSSFSRGKGIAPDIRELLRSPDREKEVTFPHTVVNKKCPSETKAPDGKMEQTRSLDDMHKGQEMADCNRMEVSEVEEKNLPVQSSKESSALQPVINVQKNESTTESDDLNKAKNGGTVNELHVKENINTVTGKDSSIKEECFRDTVAGGVKNEMEGEGKLSTVGQADNVNAIGQISERPVDVDMKAPVAEESPKKENLSKGESSSPEKPSPNEKSRKKGIVRRILLKGGNEIYRKAGEMVRSVRRGTDSKEDVENVKETENQKESKDIPVAIHAEATETVNIQKEITLDLQDEVADSVKSIESEILMSEIVHVEEAINPSVLIPSNEIIQKIDASNQEVTSPVLSTLEENVISKNVSLDVSEEAKVPVVPKIEPEKQVTIAKAKPVVPVGSQPPIMAPRPSFLHGKTMGLPWSAQSPSRSISVSSTLDSNTPLATSNAIRSERAASMSATTPVKGVSTMSGQRSRLASLPASEIEVRSSSAVNTPPAAQPTLRKPGPIITGVKPAIPAKPSKVLEVSSARQGGIFQQHNRSTGERKGSTTSMGTPGSVGRSAGKRQAPKPPGMDISQRRESSSSESNCSQKDIEQKFDAERLVSFSTNGSHFDISQTEKLAENNAKIFKEVNMEVHHSNVEGNEKDTVVGSDIVNQDAGCLEKMLQEHHQALGMNVDDGANDESASQPRGTHFVKNQALNASKSSSRVARETERRQMLLQMQSNSARGPVPYPEDNYTIEALAGPDSLLQIASNTLTPLSARQRSASLGRGVGVATPRPPLPGGSLGRAAGEGAALSITTSDNAENMPITHQENYEDVLNPISNPVVPTSHLVTALSYESSNLEKSEDRLRTNSPIRSRSEGSLAAHLIGTPNDDVRLIPGGVDFETPTGKAQMVRGQDLMSESPSSVGMSGKKKRHTVRGFLKFLRRGSLRDDSCGAGYDNRDETGYECSEPKARPVIVHPLELDGACVEVVKGGGVDVRRRLEEEGAGIAMLEMTKTVENAGGMGCLVLSEQSKNTPRRPTSIPLAPPRPPPVLHSPSSPSLSSSSSSSSGSTPVRPRPPPPPRGMAPVPPSLCSSGQKPARPPPPKPAHLLRLGLSDRGTPVGAVKSSGDGIYANLGEVRATLTPCKPQRTASMREVIIGASGKPSGDPPTPRIVPRNLQIDAETTVSTSSTASVNFVDPHNETFSNSTLNTLTITSTSKSHLYGNTISHAEITNSGTKCDKLSWRVGAAQVPPNLTPSMSDARVLCMGAGSSGADSSSEEENVPPLPLVPPPSPPPPLPLHPPPSPPSHPTSSSSSSSLINPLTLPEDSGYESVEFHAIHDGDVTGGRWWAESGIAASRGSVVTTTTDSLEESYEAVVGANHRALADVLAQVCQPNPEEFGACSPLQWSDFLVEGPKGGIVRSVGPVAFHRAAMKGKGGIASGADSWRRVTLGVSPHPTTDLPQYFRGCACHEGGNAPVGRCTPSLRSLCVFHDNVPNRFFCVESNSNYSAEMTDLIQATVMVFNPLHLYSLKTYLVDMMSERKSAQRFPPLPEDSNWFNRVCLFLLVLLDALCSLDWCGGEEGLCVIREEARPGPTITEGDGEVSDGSHAICPLPRLCVLPNVAHSKVDLQSSPSLCFQSVVSQILEGIQGDAGTDSFVHALQCIVGLQRGEDFLSRSRAALELWLFGPSILHSVTPHVSGERMQDELVEARDIARWSTKNPILTLSEAEPTSVEGELSHAAPRRWLDLERAGALRSLAVSALHRGGRIPSPVESSLESSNGEEVVGGLVGKCCRGWRVGEVAGSPSLPTCEEFRLRFLVGTSGSEVAEAWELLARTDPSSPMSVNFVRTLADVSSRKLASWNITNNPERAEVRC